MVSGLVTSPWDQLRIFSGEARLMRIASKSAIVLPRSNGLERYKVASDCDRYVIAFRSPIQVASCQLLVASYNRPNFCLPRRTRELDSSRLNLVRRCRQLSVRT